MHACVMLVFSNIAEKQITRFNTVVRMLAKKYCYESFEYSIPEGPE